MVKVFIDGSAGTTGLQIRQRLEKRDDLILISLPEELRKDISARQEAMNQADVVFLCLPDDAAREAVTLVNNPSTAVIDTSTAHRVNPDWIYGFPELGFADKIRSSRRIANPGCHATGFISIVYPMVSTGILPKDALLTCFSLTGYSGGGKKMIAQYEDPEADPILQSPAIYGLNQNHKHLPEMKLICGLNNYPVFCPVVDDYLKGMAGTVSFHSRQLNGLGADQVRQALADFYQGQPLISVAADGDVYPKLYGSCKAGRDSLEIVVTGNEERFTVSALFDNLGKGASGAAIENMNLVLGLDPTTGLVL